MRGFSGSLEQKIAIMALVAVDKWEESHKADVDGKVLRPIKAKLAMVRSGLGEFARG
jgi:hypothetical protein